jgi:hypothetical protein
MAICNLFNKITNPTGTFFTFSQYTEDLTKVQTNPGYKVIPSKFICFNTNFSNWDNDTFPMFLQNNIENGAAFLRTKHEEYNADNFKQTFWDEVIKNKLFNKTTTPIVDEAVYCGDINIQSYSEQDGMGYSEIYCYIPNNAQKQTVNINDITSATYVSCNDTYICGYDKTDASYLYCIDEVFNSGTADKLLFGHDYLYDSALYDMNIKNPADTTVTDKFEFNTVLVLYKVAYYDADAKETIIYEDIPLGLYITGMINSGSVDNHITKYISNDDIYSSGTSYGLRICSCITPTQNGTYIRTETTVDDLGIYESLTQAMSSMIDSQVKMDETLGSLGEYHKNVKDHLDQFKNSRVNVPYIRQINGIDYWFVNGKNTEVKARGDGSCYIDTSKPVGSNPAPTAANFEDPSLIAKIAKDYNFKTGDYTIASDTGDIYVYYENIFKKSTSIKGAPGRDGSRYIDTSTGVSAYPSAPSSKELRDPGEASSIALAYNFQIGDYTIAYNTGDIYVYDGIEFKQGANIKTAPNIFSHLSDSGQLLNSNVIYPGDPLTNALSVVDNTEYLEFHIDLNNIELLPDKYYIIDTTSFSTKTYSEGYKLHIHYASDGSTKDNNYKKFYIFIINDSSNSSNDFNLIKFDNISTGRHQEKTLNLKGNSLVTLDLFNLKDDYYCKISAEDEYELI